MPAMTRPTIKASEVGAAPHRALPISNTAILDRSRVLTLNSPYARHKVRMIATDAIANPRPTHARFSMWPRSSYTWAWTSAEIVSSRPSRKRQREFWPVKLAEKRCEPYRRAPKYSTTNMRIHCQAGMSTLGLILEETWPDSSDLASMSLDEISSAFSIV